MSPCFRAASTAVSRSECAVDFGHANARALPGRFYDQRIAETPRSAAAGLSRFRSPLRTRASADRWPETGPCFAPCPSPAPKPSRHCRYTAAATIRSAPCNAPSSPPGPWRAIQTRSNPAVANSVSERSLRRIPGMRIDVIATASASSTALPVSSDTSRSLESPPNMTATRPNCAASVMRVRRSLRNRYRRSLH